MKKYTFLLLSFVLTYSAFGQEPVPPRGKVFDDNLVPRVDILIAPADLAQVLDPNNDTEYPAVFIFTNDIVPDTVENVGFRLRGNTSLFAAKKSFKVSFNAFVSGQKYKGLEKLNLNGEHNDPSVTRSKVCWDLLRDMELPGARANHVELYINGDYFGLYANIEHIDEEFVDLRFGNQSGNLYKCLYPADLVYLGSNPDAYKLEAQGRRVYELLTNTAEDDYSDLAEFIDVLNNTSDADFACEIEKVFNVDAYLQYMVFDILTGNWDGPLFNKNNFYLYHNPVTDLFEYIPYDLDNTLGIDWFGEDWGNFDIYNWTQPEDRPLYDRFIADPIFREQFNFYMERLIDDEFNLTKLEDNLDFIRTLIGPYIQTDPYYPLDYGFTFQQFQDSYEQALPFGQTPYGIKPYIETRGNSALDQLEPTDIAPIIYNVNNNLPTSNQDIRIYATVIDDGSVSQVRLCYSIDGGTVECLDMKDDGNSGDFDAGDDIYGIILPALGTSANLEYQVVATDDSSQDGIRPYCNNYQLAISEPLVELYINELMASNSNTIADPFGEYDDWLELYYAGSDLLFIGGYYLSDNPAEPNKWSLPDIFLEPGEFLILWIDGDNDTQGDEHTSFKLSADGETIGLYDGGLNLIDGLTYPSLNSDQAYGRIPDGTGPFELVMPTPGATNVALSDILNIEVPEALAVFPNPSSGLIYLDIEQTLGASNLYLIDALGRTVWQQSSLDLYPGRVEVQLAAAPGMYQLLLVDENGVSHLARLVINK
ncbi:MAG: CotH kinase family protein [Saprospiraceae bacterium]|nr:CotH kinase family protein [Saprospiraceae bacterium]